MSATGERAAREAGQTLIEMLVVLAIMTLVVGIAAPMIGRLLTRRSMVEAEATVVLGVAEARADAVARAGAVRLALGPAGDGQEGARLITSTGRPDRVLPAGTNLDWPRDGVVFYGDGTASAWDGAIHDAAATRHFRIDPARARVDFGA